METKTEKNKEEQQQWEQNHPISQSSSSSRSSSITSDSSDGHFVLRNFPLPKPTISVSEAQKQREIYNSGQLFDLPGGGYDPNRIPSSVFSSKPANSTTDWSIASNESLFSIHDGNFRNSRLSEIPRFEEPLCEITEIEPVSVPVPVPVPLPLPPVEKADSEIDEEEEMIELESEDGNDEEEGGDVIEPVVLVKPEVIEEDVKEMITKPDDLSSTVSHSPSISCRSDTSNNSTCSFAFPLLQKEDGITKTPSIQNVSHKRRPQYQLPQPPQPQPDLESNTLPQPQSQQKGSKKFESQTQSPKAPKRGLFSCFHCPKKCGFFK